MDHKIKLDLIDEDLRQLCWKANRKGFHLRTLMNSGEKPYKQKWIGLSHIIIERMTGRKPHYPQEMVDHINGDPFDNRRANLRFASHAQNMRNRKLQKNNLLKVKGVQKSRDKFRARIRHAGVVYNLGVFQTIEEAAEAYKAAAKKLHGEFCRQD